MIVNFIRLRLEIFGDFTRIYEFFETLMYVVREFVACTGKFGEATKMKKSDSILFRCVTA